MKVSLKSGMKPELLMPAGSLEVLKTAIHYGADAVYIGGDYFSLRAKAKNFSLTDMKEGLDYAHSKGKKVYLTANILAHNDDIRNANVFFEEIANLDFDALILSDPGLFMLAKQLCPNKELHISTQANNTNANSFMFWKSLGASRCVAARELSLKELKEIKESIGDMQLEAFVHGAMCMSYSGRCLLSNFMTGRDGNQVACTHPCRWKYSVVEEQRPNEFMPVYENERGTYIFNSKDLCMIDKLPDMIEAGIDSLKVEGRMKTALYVASVARAYRMAIDTLYRDEDEYRANIDYYLKEIMSCTYRNFTRGFFYGKPNNEAQIYDSNTYNQGAVYLGVVEDFDSQGFAVIEQKNKFSKGDILQIMSFDGMNIDTEVQQILNEDGQEQESAPHSKQKLHLKLSVTPKYNEILRKSI